MRVEALLEPGSAGGVVELEGPLDLSALRDAAQRSGAQFVDLSGVASKEELLAAISVALDLPDWFGHNWDALDEVLRAPDGDRSGPVLIAWPDPPVLTSADPATARTFRSVVSDAAFARQASTAGPLVLATGANQEKREQMFELPLSTPTRVHHVAIVVRNMDAALSVYRDQLRLPLDVLLPIESDGVRIAFLPVGESNIELVEPTDPSTGVARFLESRGEGFHHVCLEVDDVAVELDRLAANGLELIDTAPRRGAEGPVAFIHPRSCNGVLVELIEAPGGPAWKALGYDPEEAQSPSP
jgi:methylmalonyl-CoA epimerase